MNRSSNPRASHYSYSVYSDPAMAESFDELRFSGPVGELLARAQEEVIARFLEPVAQRTVLDVGTGTGRAAIALTRRGASVTGIDASSEMLAVAKRRALAARVDVSFQQGDAHELPYPAASFDSVICLRVLMHTPDWRKSLGELCRVAGSRVVFDYPALASAAALQSGVRRIAHAAGVRVEAYRVFSGRAIRSELARHGFRLLDAHKQFVLPIVLHKRINSLVATERVEGILAKAGLRALLGSPVTVVAERCASS